jgi:hypothetical protein
MWSESDESNYLEDMFSILRFRRRGVASFRKFVILHARGFAKVLHAPESATQPLRAHR